MSRPRAVIDVEGRSYTVEFERRIVRAQREVMATAYDVEGTFAGREVVSTATARSYLTRDTTALPATWDELEDLALSNLKLTLEE